MFDISSPRTNRVSLSPTLFSQTMSACPSSNLSKALPPLSPMPRASSHNSIASIKIKRKKSPPPPPPPPRFSSLLIPPAPLDLCNARSTLATFAPKPIIITPEKILRSHPHHNNYNIYENGNNFTEDEDEDGGNDNSKLMTSILLTPNKPSQPPNSNSNYPIPPNTSSSSSIQVQNNNFASMIGRFWDKVTGCSPEKERQAFLRDNDDDSANDNNHFYDDIDSRATDDRYSLGRGFYDDVGSEDTVFSALVRRKSMPNPKRRNVPLSPNHNHNLKKKLQTRAQPKSIFFHPLPGESHSVSARLEEDENTRDGSREMATDIMATSTTKLTLFHPFRFDWLAFFVSLVLQLKMRLASLGAENQNHLYFLNQNNFDRTRIMSSATSPLLYVALTVPGPFRIRKLKKGEKNCKNGKPPVEFMVVAILKCGESEFKRHETWWRYSELRSRMKMKTKANKPKSFPSRSPISSLLTNDDSFIRKRRVKLNEYMMNNLGDNISVFFEDGSEVRTTF